MDLSPLTGATRLPADDRARVTVGSLVVYQDEVSNETEQVVIVPHAEADFTAGRISADSPLARALLRHAIDDPVRASTPGGVRHLRIMSIKRGA